MGTRALCQSLHTTMTSPPYLGHLHLRSSTPGRRGILSLQHTSAQRQLLHERLSDAVASSERARSEPGASRPFVSSVSPISPGWPSAPPCRSRQSGPGCRQSPRNEVRGIYSGDLRCIRAKESVLAPLRSVELGTSLGASQKQCRAC